MHFKINEDGNYTDIDRLPETPNTYPAQHPTVLKWIDAGNTPDPYVGPTALELWEQQMDSSDNVLPRWAEDLYDALPLEIRDVINPVTKNKMIQKKAQRAMKPSA